MIIHIFSQDYKEPPIYFSTLSTNFLQNRIDRPSGLIQFSQLLFVLDGKGMLYCEGKKYKLERGCAFYLDKTIPHCYENCGELITAWLTFDGSACREIERYIENRHCIFFEKTDVKRYVAMIEQVKREYLGMKREGILSSMVYSTVMSFFDENIILPTDAFDNVLRYIEEHFSENITINQLTALIYQSKSTLCKKFKEKFGCSVFEKIMDIRLLNAEMLLRLKTNEKINVISRECGFSDVGYFCKAYKKRFGITPSQAREISS